MLIKKIIFFGWLLLVAFVTMSQPSDIKFTSLTSKDGLLSNSVNAILKDRHGLMWFATDDGLNKYDGTNFTVYRHNPGDSSSLRANEVLALHEDRSGNLWVGTSGGAISLYDRAQGRFINYPASGNIDGFTPSVVIKSICSDYLGKIWIAEYSSVYVLNPATKRITRLNLLAAMPRQQQRLALNCVFEDKQHRMWVGTNQGLFLYNREKNMFRQLIHDDADTASLPANEVNAIAEDPSGNLWFGTANGVCKLQSGETGFVSYKQPGNKKSEAGSQYVNTMAADKDGFLWVGTMHGLHIVNPVTGQAVSYMPGYNNPYSPTAKAIRCICIDKEGIYWMGTYQGGINKYDKNLNLFNTMLGEAFHETGPGSSIVTSFAECPNHNILVGTDGGGLYEFNKTTAQLKPLSLLSKNDNISSLSILALKKAVNGKVYVGTYANGLFIINPSPGGIKHLVAGPRAEDLGANDIFSIMEDSRGQVWLGTNGAGVNVLKDDRIIAKYTPAPAKAGETRLPVNGYIRAFAEDSEGNIWIGSHGDGVAVYNPRDGHFRVYKQDNSNLPGDKVQCLMLDHAGNMWVGTYGGGLSLFDKKNNRFINFSEKDGLQNATIYQVIEDAFGTIWVSTNTGISSFDVNKRVFRNYNHNNGLQNNNFVHGAGMRMADGELFFGGLQGFNYFNPAQLTTNRNVPKVIITDLKIANKSVIPGKDAPIKEQVSVANEIRLDYKQNFALSFVALNYTMPRQNHYAYMLEGFDKDWNYTGPLNTAYYTNLDPGTYTFRVKASNNDGIWSSTTAAIKIYVKPPFWLTIYAYIFYVLAVGGILFYSRYQGIKKIRMKFFADQEKLEVKRAQELDKLKLKFLTNLSHEFRTPISLIMGPVDQLLEAPANERSKEKLSMIRRNARRLLNLVNQLLDFRKMEEQELKLHLSQNELVSFVKDISYSFADLSERKNIKFGFNSNINSLYVYFDSDKLERILFNLLSNAFKFTLPGGTVTVSLAVEDCITNAEVKWVIVTVTDTGIGIDAVKKERIFDRFFQSSSTGILLNQGTGIGLSITREFVQMHNGTIEVESEVNKGSIFTFRLPLTLSQKSPADEIINTSAGETPLATSKNAIPVLGQQEGILPVEKPVILIVEDNEDFRFYLKDNLRNLYTVVEAANGLEGWKAALSTHPRLVVSDISMPGMDGIALVQKLKADERTTHIPVILLTAMAGDKAQLEGLGMGANDYITKPFNFEVLSVKIKNTLTLSNRLKDAYTRQVKVITQEPVVQSEDEKLLYQIVAYLEENITNPQLSVELLSQQLGMSRSSLYSKMLKITGQKPVEYIRSFKLEKAAILLQKKAYNVAEVAYMTGFSTPAYFTRAFKAKFNVHPSSYAASTRTKDGDKGVKID